jgi:hypothetical protein
VITGLVAIVKLWLNRDRRRSIALRKVVDGKQMVEIEILAENASEQTIRDTIDKLTR